MMKGRKNNYYRKGRRNMRCERVAGVVGTRREEGACRMRKEGL